MGQQAGAQDQLFYSFSLETHIPSDHILRSIDRFLHLGALRHHLSSFYSHTGRPSIDPELMIRMLIIGYCFGIRSERRLCQEVHLNLAYRWFCRLNLDDAVPEHSTFSKNRHGRFRASATFRWLFDEVVRSCMAAGLVKGEGFAVDASVVAADASRQRGVPSSQAVDWKDPRLSTAEVESAKTMIDRVEERFQITPERLIGDTAYGTAAMLAWMVDHKGIEPHVPVWERWQRNDDTLPSSEFRWSEQADEYRCPQGHPLRREWRAFKNPRTHITKADTIIYRSSQSDCGTCPLKERCCPKTPTRKIVRSIHEAARDVARRIRMTMQYQRSRCQRKKVEMLFAHLKRILKLDRLRLRGLTGATDEFTLAAAVQNLRRLAKLIPQGPAAPA